MASSVERPNIRIEIQNDVRGVEAMDVDEEEGEIVEKVYEEPQDSKLVPPADALGVAEKLAERARRFDLRPDETNPFTRADLDELYSSLGVDPSDADDLYGDTIHVRGSASLTSADLLDYFYRYAPVEVGWSSDDDGSCSVRFEDGGAAARALFYLSRPIDGVPVRRPTDALVDEDEEEVGDILETEAGRSVLLRDRRVEFDDVQAATTMPVPPLEPARKFKDSIDVSEVDVPIPPGYWRYGGPVGATKSGALMRFGSRTDKKPFRVESLGRGYKKPGQISERQMRELRSIFQRNKHMRHEKNPWGTLARSWDEDVHREPERRPEVAQFEVKNPDLLERLGRKTEEEVATPKSPSPPSPPPEDAPVAAKRSKVPRMRMYADEEEERVRRRKLLRTLKAQESRLATTAHAHTDDLRATLTGVRRAAPSAVADVITIDSDHDRDDLSLRLRNRTRNMVFAVGGGEEQEEEEEVEVERDGDVRSDVRSFLDRRRSDRRKPTVRSHRSPAKRTRTAQSYSAHARNYHTHEHCRRRADRSASRERADAKPRSRVAVVVHKPPTRPTVASTIWRPEAYASASSSSGSSSDSDDSSESDEEEEEEGELERSRRSRSRSGGRVKVRLGARR